MNLLKESSNFIVKSYFKEAEFVDFSKIDLKKEYDKWNVKLFNNELPSIPLKFSKLKNVSGVTTATAKKVGRFGLADVQNIAIKISTTLNINKSELDAILIHEMIHVFFLNNGVNENHGPDFKAKAKELSSRAQIEIPLTHDVSNSTISKDLKPKEVAFALFERPGNKVSVGLGVVRLAVDLHRSFERIAPPKGSKITTGKASTLLVHKLPVGRKTPIKFFGIKPDEAQELLSSAEITKVLTY